ncbi:hypothetical protein L228DRAFT_255352 [Xylona heveae TC161]|uniref:EKC/KEOPS complex subunit BUD32 n=1 Tax=Xylona heveae (strain CBS 132557 / TC161) TaxID=1328760 RepID=A0A165HWP6_XYLHT|nr:hypothetical protein L228DRAFT_255352 [Xylona heveae TC161]KZF24031.1 hypothetical protein L228DRAFT_255352 [Xylona heveae TC161]
MIPPEYRISPVSQCLFGDSKISTTIDYDERRWYTITGPLSYFGEDGEKEIGVLKRYIDQLSPNVCVIRVDENGLLVTVSSDPRDDPTFTPEYPRYLTAASLQNYSTVKLSQLSELDRIGPSVDLTSYLDEKGVTKKVVFKYAMTPHGLARIWREMHLFKSLPTHPNIIAFDRIVVDDIESRILGFATIYVPGGTLDDNRSRVFRLEWLQQLTDTVDYLNLELGIFHGDIAPWNLVIHPETGKIQLLDFERGGWLAHNVGHDETDITCLIFTVYAIITEDYHFRDIQTHNRDPETVQSLEEWPVICELDSDVGLFRKHLVDWAQRRKTANVQRNKWPRPLMGNKKHHCYDFVIYAILLDLEDTLFQ